MHVNIYQASNIQSSQKSALEKRAFQPTFTAEIIQFKPYLIKKRRSAFIESFKKAITGVAGLLFLFGVFASNLKP